MRTRRAITCRPSHIAEGRCSLHKSAGHLVAGQVGQKAFTVSDKGGEHLLIFAHLTSPSKTAQRSARNERTDFSAVYYTRIGEQWTSRWAIRDCIECPGLDHTAQFFTEHVTVTDLNADGSAEVTVAYKLFCGGGIDSSILKIIMRDGDKKCAMCGTTIVKVPGTESFCGKAVYDKSLQNAENAAFRKHLSSVRARVVTEED